MNFNLNSWLELTIFLEGWNHIPRVKAVSWNFPTNCCKLNTDGSSWGNPGDATGGGILRNSSGIMIFAFTDHFGIKSSSAGCIPC